MSIASDSIPIPHEGGHWISERVSRVVEIIQDYDSTLEVRWIPPALRDPGDAAFAIVEHTLTGPVVAFYVQTEAEFDERVLARIFAGDNSKHNVLGMVEAQNAAIQAYNLKKYQDELAEAADISAHILRSPKTRYSVGTEQGKVVFE